MLQFLSTLSPPFRFGQPPDSRRMISPNFLKCSGSHPAWEASSGNQLMSPCVKTTGFTGFSTRSTRRMLNGARATNCFLEESSGADALAVGARKVRI